MRQLRRDVDAPVAAGRHRPLPVQCLRAVLQDERPEPAADQAQAETSYREYPLWFRLELQSKAR